MVGYNCLSGRCDFIPFKKSGPNWASIAQLSAMTIPFSLVVISYAYILWYFLTTYRKIKSCNLKVQLEFRTTWALLITFLIPGILLFLLYLLDYFRENNEGTITPMYETMLFLYYLPYGTNFLWYLTSTQYRMAFIFFYRQMKNWILCKKIPIRQDSKSCYVNTEADLSTFKDIEGIQSYFD